MSPNQPGPGHDEQFWREFLSHPDTFQALGRRLFSRMRSDPRCVLCAAPFRGAGGGLMRAIGKRQSSNNPNFCTSCEKVLVKHRGGAEVEASMLFADIRGSTAIAERMSATEFRFFLDRFYAVASRALFSHNGVVDKFVGDEVVAVFPPMLGADHAARAVAAARALLEGTGHSDEAGPWVPVGIGVHTGIVWFGAVGDEQHVEITVIGDAVNITARLASNAVAGEVLMSSDAASAAGLGQKLERRRLSLKGKELPFEAVSQRVAAGSSADAAQGPPDPGHRLEERD